MSYHDINKSRTNQFMYESLSAAVDVQTKRLNDANGINVASSGSGINMTCASAVQLSRPAWIGKHDID